MAKGGEDTAAYNAGRLLATVEVGSDPDDAARRLDDFHEAMSDRLLRTPMALSATSTHDSKRSEDLRSRLAVLSEMPARWSASLETFRAVNAPHRCQRGAGDVPDAAEETYLYETLVGSFPLSGEVSTEYVARIEQHMEKAVREAKRHSSWTDPNEHYESLVRHFVSSVLSPANGVFLSLLGQLSNEIGPAGAANSLGLCLLRVVAPGVPDTYQGTERWSLALVDPDNRRYVDLSEAASVLDNLDYFDDLGSGLSSSSLLSTWEDGRVKLAVLARSLRLRRAHAGTFEDGAYLPLAATGVGGEHVIAFARIAVDHFAVAAAVQRPARWRVPGASPSVRASPTAPSSCPPARDPSPTSSRGAAWRSIGAGSPSRSCSRSSPWRCCRATCPNYMRRHLCNSRSDWPPDTSYWAWRMWVGSLDLARTQESKTVVTHGTGLRNSGKRNRRLS